MILSYEEDEEFQEMVEESEEYYDALEENAWSTNTTGTWKDLD